VEGGSVGLIQGQRFFVVCHAMSMSGTEAGRADASCDSPRNPVWCQHDFEHTVPREKVVGGRG
jgi:hypothetical protein